MANVSPVHSGDESANGEKRVDQAANTKSKKNGEAMDVDGSESENENESEYEIEEILDAKRGSFPEVWSFHNTHHGVMLKSRPYGASREEWAIMLNGKAMVQRKTVGWTSKTRGKHPLLPADGLSMRHVDEYNQKCFWPHRGILEEKL